MLDSLFKTLSPVVLCVAIIVKQRDLFNITNNYFGLLFCAFILILFPYAMVIRDKLLGLESIFLLYKSFCSRNTAGINFWQKVYLWGTIITNSIGIIILIIYFSL